jgi:hypothetical protein
VNEHKQDKDFDCVEMKNKAQAQIYEIIKDMSPAEELAYWRQKEEEFAKEKQLLLQSRENLPAA